MCINCRLFKVLAGFRKAGFIVLFSKSKPGKTYGADGYPWKSDRAKVCFDVFAPRVPTSSLVSHIENDAVGNESGTVNRPDDYYLGSIFIHRGRLVFIQSGEEQVRGSELGEVVENLAKTSGCKLDIWDW